MHFIIIFVLPFLLAGQGMIHCVLTKCCDEGLRYPQQLWH
jgi:hypothetical protein